MIKQWKYVLPGIILLSVIPLISQTENHGNTSPVVSQQKTKSKAAPAAKQSEDGDRVFQQNCSRCHNAPESFSPRISGTIIRHMRVRANLSKQDEEVLMRFLNP
jgi:cytochrome c5